MSFHSRDKYRIKISDCDKHSQFCIKRVKQSMIHDQNCTFFQQRRMLMKQNCIEKQQLPIQEIQHWARKKTATIKENLKTQIKTIHSGARLQSNLFKEQVLTKMKKEEVRKNRERIRNSIKKCLSGVPTECSIQKIKSPFPKINEMIFNKLMKKSSEEIRQFDELKYLKETHVTQPFQHLFEPLEKIGEGCHSSVYKCREVRTGKIFACKDFKAADTDSFRHFKEHFLIKRAINHENIIKAYYLLINENQNRVQMICEYCPYNNLKQFMNHHKKIKESTIASILHGILSGVSQLHRHGVCHRDLKPQNILYNHKTGELKLIDFQISKMSKYADQQLEMWTNTGTLYYKAPQMFQGGYKEHIDLWAIGVIAYELAYGKRPFDREYVCDTITEICEKEPNYDSEDVSPLLKLFIKGCLTKDTNQRMRCYEAIHSLFLLKYEQGLTQSPNIKSPRNHNAKYQDCNCKDYKENYHEQVLKPLLRRTHSSNQLLNQRKIFEGDIGIRFLEL